MIPFENKNTTIDNKKRSKKNSENNVQNIDVKENSKTSYMLDYI